LVTVAAKLGGGRSAHGPWLQLAEAQRTVHAAGVAEESSTVTRQKAVEGLEAAAAMVAGIRMKRGNAPEFAATFLATYRRDRKHVILHIHNLELLRSHLTSPAKRQGCRRAQTVPLRSGAPCCSSRRRKLRAGCSETSPRHLGSALPACGCNRTADIRSDRLL